MKRVLSLVGLLLLFAEGVTDAKTPPAKPAVLGEWHGKYICTQGVTALKLIIAEGPKGKITATFRFGPLPENPEVPRGLYAMEGSYEVKTRRLKLKGAQWIDASSGYSMVDLDGGMDASGQRLSGRVPFPGCTRFELERDAPFVS